MKYKIPKENEKITRNQTTFQKSHKRDKYLSCPPSKILGNILKLDERRTLINGAKIREKS